MSGAHLWLAVFGGFLVIAFLLLLTKGLGIYLAPLFSDQNKRAIAVAIGYLTSDLLLRYILAPRSFAEYAYYTLPISKTSYAWQSLFLAHVNIVNLLALGFFTFYLSGINLEGDFKVIYLTGILVLVSTNNLLVLLLKRSKIAIIVAVTFIGSAILHYKFYLVDIVYNQIVANGMSTALVIWAVAVVAAFIDVFYHYTSESYQADGKPLFRMPRFGFNLKDPILWQEVLLIIRNKRPRGLLISYLIMPPYLLYTLRKGLMVEEPSAGILFFLLYFIIGGLAVQYGYLGLSWESMHFDVLMTRTRLRDMLISKYKLLTYLNIIAVFIALLVLIAMPAALFPIIAVALFQIGMGTYFVLYIMAYNNKRIDINKTSFFNYQGISAAQFINPLVLLFAPCLIFWLMSLLLGSTVTFAIFGAIGLAGLLYRNRLFSKVNNHWVKYRYHLIENYRRS
ncbi:hypothetical protein E1176_07950 [Fulvivirga sp. RKSG066]|nr:hypothetical protein [Fulvivirga aurantia]